MTGHPMAGRFNGVLRGEESSPLSLKCCNFKIEKGFWVGPQSWTLGTVTGYRRRVDLLRDTCGLQREPQFESTLGSDPESLATARPEAYLGLHAWTNSQ